MIGSAARGLGGACALIGGTLMVISGFTSHGFFLSVISYVNSSLAPGLPSPIQAVVGFVLLALNVLITFGGIIVICGGALLLYGRSTIGSALMMLGGGVGFPSLLIAIVYYLLTSGVISVVDHSEYWLGVLLAATARRLAKNA